MSSKFRFFRIRASRVWEDRSFERSAITLYRKRTHCGSAAADPNVWGFGWDREGASVFLLVQSTANQPCGQPDELISLVVRTSDGRVVESLSRALRR